MTNYFLEKKLQKLRLKTEFILNELGSSTHFDLSNINPVIVNPGTNMETQHNSTSTKEALCSYLCNYQKNVSC